jgi:hypothetical protein
MIMLRQIAGNTPSNPLLRELPRLQVEAEAMAARRRAPYGDMSVRPAK